MPDDRHHGDWVTGRRAYVVAWGIPTALLIASIWTGPPLKVLLWSGGLLWMGLACLANARRCGRTHCFFTGPFFLAMAVVSTLHGTGIIPLGDRGWHWLGAATGIGAVILWWASEAWLGTYRRPKDQAANAAWPTSRPEH